MHIGQTLPLFTFENEKDEGRAFDATLMILDREDGVVHFKELGKQPETRTIQWVAQSMAMRKIHDAEAVSV